MSRLAAWASTLLVPSRRALHCRPVFRRARVPRLVLMKKSDGKRRGPSRLICHFEQASGYVLAAIRSAKDCCVTCASACKWL